MGSPVRVSAITSNASLVVALTLRVEEWEVQSGGSASALGDLELTDVLLIDQGNTKDGLVELAEARARCPTARAIVVGDEEADVSELDRLLLRPFTLEDLANAINEAGALATADGEAAGGAEDDDLVVLDDDTPGVDEWAEPEPFEADDLLTSATAAEPPPPVAIDEPLVLDEEQHLEPTHDEDEFTSAGIGDEPGTSGAVDELDWVVPESISAAPSQPVVEEEPAPFEGEDEPAPFAADLTAPGPTTLEDDELEPWSADVERAPAAREAVVADELAAAPPVIEPRVEEEPAAEEEMLAPARATGRGDRSTRRKARRSKRKKGEALAGPTELAAELMASVAPRQRGHADLNARVAEILMTGLDLELLLEEMPILRSRGTLGTALAAELAQDLEAETVSAWVPTEKGFLVVGGWGLTRAELKAKVPASQPLLSELSETGGATLIVPIDLAGAAVAGIAGARTKALMATAIGIGDDRYAFVAVGADNYEEEDLDALVEMAVEAAPMFAVAAMIDRLRDT